MSGFEFYILCRACGLASTTYPLIYETVYCPTTLVLPVIDRAQRKFDRLEIPVTKRFSEESLGITAASFSDPDRVVCLPRFNREGDGCVLEPEVRCPTCDGELVCPFGGPPRRALQVTSIAELLELSRTFPEDTTERIELADSPAVVRCTRFGGTTFHWHVRGRHDVHTTIAKLRAYLIAAGSMCSEPEHSGGFSVFDEERP